ncbi:MAG: trypsin-like peptidase domain-containing protein [Cyanomargarita calcarea GSE-NOS-MK-12-04C]|uniref:Trypsin-like peptidase domain-containing protein n=1 Tax=Cyanomargarita calcarea GSE-NOS-MK-12-04C TaxID=2839659 RepID=A0A951QXI2_9CYAN|nr:trypsin-like peptidase domain-containing protein [Cyanomargarita calcarea GSE-NOS-MK-12-04C]
MNITTFRHLTEELADIAAKLRNSTVKVRTSCSGGGSGVIWQSDGLIITNAHVATSKQAIVELADGQVFNTVRTQFDPTRDLAVLKIAATELPVATIGNLDALRVGELVIAVGNPFGDHGAVTTGIIHTKNQNAVMADIRLFPGNSGGPLADCFGRVIGINTMIVNGLAVAIPTAAVERFLHGEQKQCFSPPGEVK